MQRLESYKQTADKLIAEGKAYRCYCTREELDARRKAFGEGFRYEGTCRDRKDVPSLPGSLDASLTALENDHEFLLKGDVFTQRVIDRWIEYKREREIQPLRLRPHPLEFSMYYDV